MIANSVVIQRRSLGQFYTFYFIFYKKISQVQKSTKPLTVNKNKTCVKKTSK